MCEYLLIWCSKIVVSPEGDRDEKKERNTTRKGVAQGNQSSFRTLHRCNSTKCIVLNQFISISLKTWFALSHRTNEASKKETKRVFTSFKLFSTVYVPLVRIQMYMSDFEAGRCYETNILLILWLEKFETFWKIISWVSKFANFRLNLFRLIYIQVWNRHSSPVHYNFFLFI